MAIVWLVTTVAPAFAVSVEAPIPAQDLVIEETAPDLFFTWHASPEIGLVPPLTRLLRAQAEAMLRDARQQAATQTPIMQAHDWVIVKETPHLLSLRRSSIVHDGKTSRRLQRFEALYWDKQRNQTLRFADLFTDWPKARAILTPLYCAALRDLVYPHDEDRPLAVCPPLERQAISLEDGNDDILVSIDTHRVRPFQESYYETYEVRIEDPPAALRALLHPAYRGDLVETPGIRDVHPIVLGAGTGAAAGAPILARDLFLTDIGTGRRFIWQVSVEVGLVPGLWRHLHADALRTLEQTRKAADTSLIYREAWEIELDMPHLIVLRRDVGVTSDLGDSFVTTQLLWDRVSARPIVFSELFVDWPRARAIIADAFCAELKRWRLRETEGANAAVRRDDCPSFDDRSIRLSIDHSGVRGAQPYMLFIPTEPDDIPAEVGAPETLLDLLRPVYREDWMREQEKTDL